MNIDTTKIKILVIIFIIFLYHYYIHNGLEKQFSQNYLHYDIKRPLNNCKNNLFNSLSCIGMPSGHAQNCGYCSSFITLVLNDHFITTLYALITIISLFQRYLYINHNILQLVVGTFVGIGFGYLTYLLGNKYIMGIIKMKQNDNAPL